MSNTAKGALAGTLVLPILGTGIGYLAGKKSDKKRRFRIAKLNYALKHGDKDSLHDVLNQDNGEWDRRIKGFLMGGPIAGIIAGHISQKKKENRNNEIKRILE